MFRYASGCLSVFALVLLLSLSTVPVRAQEADSQFWLLMTLNQRRPDGVRLYGELQPRFGEDYSRATQLLVRGAVGKQVSPTASVWLGYAWAPAFFPNYRNEHRPFAQLVFENGYREFSMVNRSRLEFRAIDNAGGTSLRLRHWVRLARPLDREKKWSAVVANEILWNLNDTSRGPQSGFDQDRFYLGGAYAPSRHVRYEAGYQPVFINPPGGRPDRRLDVFLVSVHYFF